MSAPKTPSSPPFEGGAARTLNTYARTLKAWRERNDFAIGVVSIHFRPRGSHFSKLYMPRRLDGSSNGRYMRAPKGVKS